MKEFKDEIINNIKRFKLEQKTGVELMKRDMGGGVGKYPPS
jgi:hypothetical protein